MDKPLVTVITTNWDLPGDVCENVSRRRERGIEPFLHPVYDRFDILGREFGCDAHFFPGLDGFDAQLSGLVGDYRQPHIELGIDGVLTVRPCWNSGWFCTDGKDHFPYPILRDVLLLQDAMTQSSSFRRRLPPGTTTIPFIFNYWVSFGLYDDILGQLDTDFTVKRVECMR